MVEKAIQYALKGKLSPSKPVIARTNNEIHSFHNDRISRKLREQQRLSSGIYSPKFKRYRPLGTVVNTEELFTAVKTRNQVSTSPHQQRSKSVSAQDKNPSKHQAQRTFQLDPHRITFIEKLHVGDGKKGLSQEVAKSYQRVKDTKTGMGLDKIIETGEQKSVIDRSSPFTRRKFLSLLDSQPREAYIKLPDLNSILAEATEKHSEQKKRQQAFNAHERLLKRFAIKDRARNRTVRSTWKQVQKIRGSASRSSVSSVGFRTRRLIDFEEIKTDKKNVVHDQEQINDLFEKVLRARSNDETDPFKHIKEVHKSYIDQKHKLKKRLEDTLESMHNDRLDTMQRKNRSFNISPNSPHAVHYDLGNMRIQAQKDKVHQYVSNVGYAQWYISLLSYTVQDCKDINSGTHFILNGLKCLIEEGYEITQEHIYTIISNIKEEEFTHGVCRLCKKIFKDIGLNHKQFFDYLHENEIDIPKNVIIYWATGRNRV